MSLLNNTSKERWKPVSGCRYYEVSDFGRVRSVDHFTTRKSGCWKGRKWFYRGRILKLGLYPKYGYFIAVLWTGKGHKTFNVHQLVADAFLPPQPLGTEINHKDGDKSNSHYKNLEWMTHAENLRHSRKMKAQNGIL